MKQSTFEIDGLPQSPVIACGDLKVRYTKPGSRELAGDELKFASQV
jgi:hypothetical protein